MQNNLIEPQNLPDLPAPSPIQLWVFEQPILPALALLTSGVLILILMRHRDAFKRVALPIGSALILLAIGVYALGTITITQREHLRIQSNELVQTVANADASGLSAMLEPNAQLSSIFANANSADRIVQLATTRNPGIVQSAEVGAVNVGIYEGQLVATTQIRVRTQGNMVPSLSWWRVDWQRRDDTSPWRVTHIEPIWIQGISDPGSRN